VVLLRLPARVWVVCYLLLIPSFATLYWLQPAHSFHDTNLQYEQAFVNDGLRLRDHIATQIAATAIDRWRQDGIRWRLLPQLVRVGAITDEPLQGSFQGERNGHYVQTFSTRGFAIEISGIAQTGTQDNGFDEGFDFSVLARYPREAACRLSVGRCVTYVVGLSSRVNAPAIGVHSLPSVSILFPNAGFPGLISDSGVLTLPKDVDDEVYRHFAAGSGDPADVSALWLRMLYLSSTTVTTLGIGDISPVSGTARALVGVEAFLGIVFIGLFLNALAARARGRDNPRGTAGA
jgi:Ion channel